MSKKWYVIHAYSGYEKSVQRALKDRIERAGMQDKFGQILVPVEEVIEMKKKYPKWTLTDLATGGQYDTLPPYTHYNYEYKDEYCNHFNIRALNVMI